LVLTTGRVLAHYQSRTQTRRVPALEEAQPECFVEIHPDTAKRLEIEDKSPVRLTTRRGAVVINARYSRDIRFDTLFVPFHWDAANVLTNAALDPVSRIPEFKVCAVRAEPASHHPSTHEGKKMNDSTPKFLQGVFSFTGAGYDTPAPFAEALDYTVPGTKRSQLIYFRGGNSAADMVSVVLLRDGKLMRHFQIGGHGAIHVPLAVVEDIEPDQKLSFRVCAPAGCSGTLIIDVGLIEI
jgi:assimilatory nitrate reductase catalytic subunit